MRILSENVLLELYDMKILLKTLGPGRNKGYAELPAHNCISLLALPFVSPFNVLLCL